MYPLDCNRKKWNLRWSCSTRLPKQKNGQERQRNYQPGEVTRFIKHVPLAECVQASAGQRTIGFSRTTITTSFYLLSTIPMLIHKSYLCRTHVYFTRVLASVEPITRMNIFSSHSSNLISEVKSVGLSRVKIENFSYERTSKVKKVLFFQG